METFNQLVENLVKRVLEWEPKLIALSEKRISEKLNNQGRNIKMIIGHREIYE